MEYIRCPRCELNYIVKGEGLCRVCRRELAGCYSEEEDEEEYEEEAENICPVCERVIGKGRICAECAAKLVKSEYIS